MQEIACFHFYDCRHGLQILQKYGQINRKYYNRKNDPKRLTNNEIVTWKHYYKETNSKKWGDIV
jgi:hypothetical protein